MDVVDVWVVECFVELDDLVDRVAASNDDLLS